MSIDKASGATHNQIDLIKGNQSLKKFEGNKSVAGASKESNPSNVDKVEISKEVQELQKTLSNLKSEIDKVPDIRQEKVDNVTARIKSGYYDEKEVITKVADSVQKAIGVSSV